MFKIIVFLTIFLIIITISQTAIGEYQTGGPPKPNDLSNITKDVAKNTKEGVLSPINDFWQKKVVPFFKNVDQKFLNWWQNSGKPFCLNLYGKIILFLEKEIFI